MVDEGGRWLCIVRQLFYLRGFIKRVLSSCGLDTAQSVELISFYLRCVNAEKNWLKVGLFVHYLDYLVLLCVYLFFFFCGFTNIKKRNLIEFFCSNYYSVFNYIFMYSVNHVKYLKPRIPNATQYFFRCIEWICI